MSQYEEILCDRCGDNSKRPYQGKARVEILGWTRYDHQDFCPVCTDVLKAVIAYPQFEVPKPGEVVPI